MNRNRSRLLSLEKHIELAKKLEVVLIMTPRSQFKKTDPKALVSEAKNLMDENDFDQLPVEHDGKISGLVRYTDISGASFDKHIGEYIYKPKQISEAEPLFKLFPLLESERCIFVHNKDFITGLIHQSDLNKQVVRTYFYLWLSAAEIGLAEKIGSEYGQDDGWIDNLSFQSQVTVRGNLAVAQKQHSNIQPMEYADFSDLINVVTKDKSKKIWSELDFTEKEWRKITGNLVELRHNVMHPVRTLVNQCSDIKNLKDCDDHLRRLVKALHKPTK